MGVFLWIYAFVVQGATRNVGGTLSWDNTTNYLTTEFWDASPTTWDIITALYGSGDEGSVYTENWTGYNSGSCLSGGMTVVYTGNLTWGALSANTIYVVASWTYDITAPIQMAECSALVSSGSVTLSGNIGNNPFIKIYGTPNTIVENIHINGNGGETDGIKIESWNNFTLNDIQTESAYIAGITITESSYGLVRNIETYNNHLWLRIIFYSTNIFLDSIITYNNSIWVYFNDTHYTTWTNIQSYNNTWDNIFLTGSHNNNFTTIITTGSLSGNWLSLFDSDYNSITHLTWSNNISWYWLYIDNWSGNLLTNIELYENTYGWSITWSSMGNTIHTMYTHNNDINFRIDTSYNTTLTDAILSTGAYFWLWIINSTGNMFSGITIYDNDNFGMLIHDSYYTTGINIISYNNNNRWLHIYNSHYNYFDTIETHSNNSWWILLSSSTYNTLQNINTQNNQEQGIGISLSNYTLLSWIIASGNTEEWIYITNSDYTTWTNLNANTNEIWLKLVASKYGYFTNLSTTNNTTHGIVLSSNTHENEFDGIVSSNNWNKGIYLSNTDNSIFSNAEIVGNLLWCFEVLVWTNNLFYDFEIYNNTGWIHLNNTSWTVLDTIYIHDNLWTGNGIFMEDTRYSFIQNSTLSNIWIQKTIVITWGYTNTISGNTLTWAYWSINIDYSFNNTITNNIWDEINMYNTTWNIIQLFGIWGYIYETHNSGLFQYTIYDAYTQTNNIISLTSEDNNVAILTGNTVSVGTTFTNHFNDVFIYNPLFEDSIYIEWAASFIISGDNWDGKIYTPTSIVAGTKLATAGETWTDSIAAFAETIEVISWDTYLTMNEWTGTILYQVSGWTSGQELNIFKSNNGNIWTPNSLNSECVLDEDLICEFDFVDDFKLFAFWVPTNLSFTGYTFENEIITSGWYYNTWIYITFTGDYISGATLDGNSYSSGDTITTDGEHIFILTDSGNNSIGITFTIDTVDPTATAISPLSGSIILTGNNINFLWTGDDDTAISSYELYVVWSSSYTISAGTDTGYTISTMLNNDSYTWYVIATDVAGNTWISNSNPFTIKAPFTGQIILTWPNTTLISSQRFTKDYANISMQGNDPVEYIITGNIVGSPITGNFATSQIRNVELTWANGRKDVFVTMSNSSGDEISNTFLIYLDSIAPTPVLISPASGATVASSFTLTWNAWPDTVWLSGYQYFVSPTPIFGTIVASGTTITPSVTLSASTLGWPETYYRYVKFIDKLGNSWTSPTQPFIYSWITDTIPDQFTFEDVEDAHLDEIYASNTITITGMTPNIPVLASVNNGALFISGIMVGTTGYVQNGWTVKIELISSDDYDETVSSTLSINGISDTFSITTEEEDDDIENYEDIETNLSNSEKLMIIAIFETLKDLYAGDKEEEFLETLMVMLENKMDEYDEDDDQYIALKYLYDLTERYYDEGDFWNDGIGNVSWIINGVYTAPNGKKYPITYDSAKRQFTSTNFITPKYFPTLDVLKYTIDIYNRAETNYLNAKTIQARWWRISIDGTRQTSPYTAPNHKVFYFFKTIEWQYSSYTFTTEKYFDNLNDVKKHIYDNNR